GTPTRQLQRRAVILGPSRQQSKVKSCAQNRLRRLPLGLEGANPIRVARSGFELTIRGPTISLYSRIPCVLPVDPGKNLKIPLRRFGASALFSKPSPQPGSIPGWPVLVRARGLYSLSL